VLQLELRQQRLELDAGRGALAAARAELQVGFAKIESKSCSLVSLNSKPSCFGI
jgi:hypothetical protein